MGFLETIVSKGYRLAAPSPTQFETPTSRPRQEGRAGRQIDCIAYKGISVARLHIHEDSHKCIGSDHELLEVTVQIRAEGRRKVHSTRPRVWKGGPDLIEHIDQEVLKQLARTCAKPKPGQGYKDPPEVKTAVQRARAMNTSNSWKDVQNLRKKARKQWEQNRIHKATTGSWEQVRGLRAQKNVGWDTHFAESQPDGQGPRNNP